MAMTKTICGAIVLQTVRDYMLWTLEENEKKRVTNLKETVGYLEEEIRTGYFEWILQQLEDYRDMTVEDFVQKLRERAQVLVKSGITSTAWKRQVARLTTEEKGATI